MQRKAERCGKEGGREKGEQVSPEAGRGGIGMPCGGGAEPLVGAGVLSGCLHAPLGQRRQSSLPQTLHPAMPTARSPISLGLRVKMVQKQEMGLKCL